MYKKILFITTLLIIIPATLLSQQRLQYIVYLKDGSIINGTIIEYVPHVSIKIQTRDGNIFVYNVDQILKLTKAAKKGSYKQEGVNEKSPGLAFALSFLVTGAGQYYNGEYKKGIIMDAIYIGGWIMYATLGWKTYDEYEYYPGGRYYWDTVTEGTAWLYIGLGAVIGSWAWSMVDAPISAKNLNQRNGQSYGHLFEFNQGKNVLGFNFGPTKKGIGASLSYHF